MKLFSEDIVDGEFIPEPFAFGRADSEAHMVFSDNQNPGFNWSDLPEGTRSLALICVDSDVPSIADDVNQEGRTIPADLPRCDFYHWVLIDINPDLKGISRGACSNEVTPGGKTTPAGPPDSRQGLNDYTGFMAGSDLAGQYFGYDGPCPPWNDQRMHHYEFTLYALDIKHLAVEQPFNGQQALQAMQPHILAQTSITGKYTLNPALSQAC